MGLYIIGDEKICCSLPRAKEYALENGYNEIYIENKANYWEAPKEYGDKWSLCCGSYQGDLIKVRRRRFL
jgi:hypothetical protein